MFNRKTLTAVAIGFAALNAAPLAAQSNAQTSIEVQTGAYNLASKEGQRALDAELKSAVREVCGVHPTLRDIHEIRDYRSCVTNAEASFQQDRDFVIAQAEARDAARMAISEEDRTSTDG
ncbi:UrcA family protein [Erythrobacter crassostreae]|uniref:UrcA family protein n=1 Tax=Erythrobacter crassostreae TaxID=2828328 RepID=A0A9X1F2U2_9SPHN|nr:UrcA family protein [Erythrobacter crassostrea]MBV7258303.1 UrcA family protein [Erythrobacter crassostrea]